MNTTNDEQMRASFEADAEPYEYSLQRASCGCCDYTSVRTEDRWNGWKAALASQPVAAEAVAWRNFPDDGAPEIDTECLVEVRSILFGNKTTFRAIDRWEMQREAPLSFSSATIETGVFWTEHGDDVLRWIPISDLTTVALADAAPPADMEIPISEQNQPIAALPADGEGPDFSLIADMLVHYAALVNEQHWSRLEEFHYVPAIEEQIAALKARGA